MRRLLVGVGVGVIAACSTFGANDPLGAGSGASDAGSDGRDPITGEPAADSFILDAPALSILPGGTAKLTVSVKRGQLISDAVTVVVKGLPNGLGARSISIAGDSGELEFTSDASEPVGATAVTLEGSSSSAMAPVTLVVDVLVRGAPGTPDPSWPSSVLPGEPGGLGSAADRTIFAVGGCRDTDGNFNACVSHFSANGALDGAYATAGVARIARRDPKHLLVQPDHRVLIGGTGDAINAWVSRLAPTGAADSSFGGGGTVLFPTNLPIDALALRSNGDVYVGYAQSYITRLDSNGAPIPAFLGAGTLTTSNGITQGLALRPNGPLAILSEDGAHNLLFVEVDADTAAPTAGQSVASPKSLAMPPISFNDFPAGLVELPDGSIIAPFFADGLYLVKLNAQGDPASGFGTNGIAGPFAAPTGAPGVPSGIALQDDGKILVALAGGTLLRFTPAATYDTTFGPSNGSLGVPTPTTGASWRHRVVVQNPGRIIVIAPTASGDTQLFAYWQ